ncbi:MAG TPA: hypothetical protein VIK91_28290, partial [Nannocystis sp.]
VRTRAVVAARDRDEAEHTDDEGTSIAAHFIARYRERAASVNRAGPMRDFAHIARTFPAAE